MDSRRARGNVLIACEECRRHKIRCNGVQPCQRRECQAEPSLCVYRRKARKRRSPRDQPVVIQTEPAGAAVPNQPTSDELSGPQTESRCQAYSPATSQSQHGAAQSVTAIHSAPRSIDSSQLFYGPSSNFAFLQEARRAILRTHPDGDLGLDSLLQRTIFFGVAPKIDPETIWSSESLLPSVPLDLAREFLEAFKLTASYRLPLYTFPELDNLFNELSFQITSPTNATPTSACIQPQTKATFFLILAVGALGTKHTTPAEVLYARAKYAAAVFDESVSLQMIWFSILMADYQANLGRPNSAYLHIGTACRKAFSLGLHKEPLNLYIDDRMLQKHRTTIWLLYFLET